LLMRYLQRYAQPYLIKRSKIAFGVLPENNL